MAPLTLHHIVREPTAEAGANTPTLVLLHGVGSNERDLMGLAPALDPGFRIISLRAPISLGPSSYGWYHVEFQPDGFLINDEEAKESLALLKDFIEGVPQPMYLMGFSQGCAMALSLALWCPEKVAGVVGMSGRLLDPLLPQQAEPERLRGLPLMVVHGTSDAVIRIQMGREIWDYLSALPVDLTYREYDMAHHVTPQSMADINAWLAERLAAPDWRTGVG